MVISVFLPAKSGKTMRILLTSIIASILLYSCHIGRMIVYNVADANDGRKFPELTLVKSEQTFRFAENQKVLTDTAVFPKTFITNDDIKDFESLFAETKTTSFLVIKNDTIVVEQYFSGADKATLFTSFSVAKSYISALVGIAVAEGHIGSIDDSITTYLQFDRAGFEKITIRHLLNMESGIRFRENYYNPFAEIGRYYYGKHLRRYVPGLKIEKEAGTEFEYRSINTLLLGMIVEKATGIPLQQYFQEKLWTPLGTEQNGSLNTDSEKGGQVKCFTGVNACARDFARFGRLYLHRGNWNGKQLIPESWILETISPIIKERRSEYYHFQWRTDNHGNFWAQGLLGQFIFVNPTTNVIIVRTGKKYGTEHWPSLMAHISKKI